METAGDIAAFHGKRHASMEGRDLDGLRSAEEAGFRYPVRAIRYTDEMCESLDADAG